LAPRNEKAAFEGCFFIGKINAVIIYNIKKKLPITEQPFYEKDYYIRIIVVKANYLYS